MSTTLASLRRRVDALREQVPDGAQVDTVWWGPDGACHLRFENGRWIHGEAAEQEFLRAVREGRTPPAGDGFWAIKGIDFDIVCGRKPNPAEAVAEAEADPTTSAPPVEDRPRRGEGEGEGQDEQEEQAS